jgi:hypothetical protein
MREEVVIRKVRSDKKKDVKPTVPVHLFDCVSDLSYIINRPIKDIVEFICMEGIRSQKVIEHLSPNFRRDYQFNNTHYIGDSELNNLRHIIRKEKSKKRISTRLTRDFYESVIDLAHVLDLTPTSATGILLEASIKDVTIIDKLISPYTSYLDENRKRVLKSVIKYIRKNNPYAQSISFVETVRYLLEWLREN